MNLNISLSFSKSASIITSGKPYECSQDALYKIIVALGLRPLDTLLKGMRNINKNVDMQSNMFLISMCF